LEVGRVKLCICNSQIPLNIAMDFLQQYAAPFSGGVSPTPLSNFLWTHRELPLSLIEKSAVFRICGVGKE
jgi:hypothetical protein